MKEKQMQWDPLVPATFEFILAGWTEREGFKIYHMLFRDDGVYKTEHQQAAMSGSGSGSICAPLFLEFASHNPRLDFDDSLKLAYDALLLASQLSEDCGGPSRVFFLRPGPAITLMQSRSQLHLEGSSEGVEGQTVIYILYFRNEPMEFGNELCALCKSTWPILVLAAHHAAVLDEVYFLRVVCGDVRSAASVYRQMVAISQDDQGFPQFKATDYLHQGRNIVVYVARGSKMLARQILNCPNIGERLIGHQGGSY